MAWNDVSAEIAIDKAIRASTHQKIFDNFAAMAAGDAGAPPVQVSALAAGTNDTSLVLKPDGSGGVFAGAATTANTASSVFSTVNAAIHSIAIDLAATYTVQCMGIRNTGGGNSIYVSGQCHIQSGGVVSQMTIRHETNPSFLLTAFQISGSTLQWGAGVNAYTWLDTHMQMLKVA